MISVTTVLVAAAITFGFTALLAGFLFYFRSHRHARYNESEHRVELEALRDSFEKRIYGLTDRLMSTEDRWRDLNHLLESRLKTQPDEIMPDVSVQLTSFLRSYGLTETDMEVESNFVLLLTPFNHKYKESYETISITCHELGLNAVRGDETQIQGDLLPHILRLIVKARVIIANIDGRNPNVFYELGIAHALGKVTILVTKSINTVPIDLKSKKLIVYQDVDQLKDSLKNELARSLIKI